MGTQKKMEWLGLPLYIWAALAVVTVAGLASGKMGTDFGSTIFWLTVVGAVLMGIGNHDVMYRGWITPKNITS